MIQAEMLNYFYIFAADANSMLRVPPFHFVLFPFGNTINFLILHCPRRILVLPFFANPPVVRMEFLARMEQQFLNVIIFVSCPERMNRLFVVYSDV